MNLEQAPPVSPQSTGPARAPGIAVARTLDLVDPRIAQLIAAERHRQFEKLVFIASESLCPGPVREAMASEFSNLYAEGYPSTRMALWERDLLDWDARHHSFYRRYGDRRYYKGCEYVNLVEAEAIRRLTALFATPEVPAHKIYANVQSLSGAAANNAVYEALVPPQGTVLGMNLSCGGHLTHGSPVNRSGKHYRIVSYGVDLEHGRLDFEALRQTALREKPSLIIAGYSAYPWTIDWAAFRRVADEVGAFLLADVAHPAGLVAAGEFPNPVGHAHVVSFTTHKTLCGPRGAVLLSTDPDLARKLDLAVFPGEQGGPHVNAIAAKAVAFRLAATEDFRRLQRRVRANAAALARAFAEAGLTLAYGGTDTHLCLINLRETHGAAVAADVAARVLDLAGITCNKNAIAGDTRAAHPSGLRFGTTWVTQRGLGPDDMAEIGAVIASTLHSMQAFDIFTSAGQVGRVRLPASVLRDTQRVVKKLADRQGRPADLGVFSYPHYESAGPSGNLRPRLEAWGSAAEIRRFGGSMVAARHQSQEEEARALRSGAAVVDTSHVPVVKVSGERAGLALQQVCSGDVLGLSEGDHVAASVLEPDGKLLGEFRIQRLRDDARGFSHYLLLGEGDAALDLLQWLRDLSDGMVSFDADVTRKIDGPVVVEDLGAAMNPAERRVLFTVAGPKGEEALNAVLGGETTPGLQFSSGEGVLLAHELPRGGKVFELVVPLAEADALAERLQSQAQLVGEKAYVQYRREQGAAAPGGPCGNLSGRENTRPYFIGQAAVVPGFQPQKPKPAFVPPPEPTGDLRRTPLHAWHKAHTKKWNLVPFAGWEMPVMYTSIVEEHRAVRRQAGLFDVAHMGVLEVRGRGAGRFLDLVTTNYATRLRDGDGQYSFTLGVEGGVLDDLLVYRRQAGRFLVVVNASNAEKVRAFWKGVAEGRLGIDADRPSVEVDVEVEVVDLKDPAAGDEQRVDLAFQGPASLPVLLSLCASSEERARLADLQRFQVAEFRVAGQAVLVARTGYTGEETGFELYVHPGAAVEIWERILEAGAPHGVLPVGLGARDSTRTEAGFPLYGHELAGEWNISPFGAGYSSFVKWHKPFFVGREPLRAAELQRTHRIMRAVVTDPAARPVRAGDTVVDSKGKYVGRVTSSAYAGADQIVLFHARRLSVQRGQALGIFPLPRNRQPLPPEPAKDELREGDSVLLPVPALGIPRFMTALEKQRRSYSRG